MLLSACGIYSFTGASIPHGVSTFQVNFFENQAGNRPGSTVEPGLDYDFTNALQDLIMNQTNLDLVTSEGQLIYEGEIIGKGHNNVIGDNDVTSHAEINAIRDASKNFGNYRLTNCSMYVTLEPCHMCAKAIVDARLKSLIYAANEPKTGSIQSIDNFLDNPDKVREQVLTLDFYETGEYPGHRSDGTEKDYQKMVKDKLSEVLQFPVRFRMDRDCFRYQLCLEGSETWIHKDDTEWAGVLYLSPNPPVDGGTVIFDEEENVVTMIGNVYNRLVIYLSLIHI